jgi:uncharacterized protein (DUF1778 family)
MDRAFGIELRVIPEEQMWITAAAEAACTSLAEYLRRETTPAG